MRSGRWKLCARATIPKALRDWSSVTWGRGELRSFWCGCNSLRYVVTLFLLLLLLLYRISLGTIYALLSSVWVAVIFHSGVSSSSLLLPLSFISNCNLFQDCTKFRDLKHVAQHPTDNRPSGWIR